MESRISTLLYYISKALSESKAFDFLRCEDELYFVVDLKSTFNEQS